MFNCLSTATFENLNRKQKSHSKLNNSNLQMLTFAFFHLDIEEEAGHVIKKGGKYWKAKTRKGWILAPILARILARILTSLLVYLLTNMVSTFRLN